VYSTPHNGEKKSKAVEYGNRNNKKNVTKKQKLEEEEMSKDKTLIDHSTKQIDCRSCRDRKEKTCRARVCLQALRKVSAHS
jgi:hypothetical protein